MIDLKPWSPVRLRGGAGREGRIVSRSAVIEGGWIVQWEGTNFRTHETAPALIEATERERKPVARETGLAARARAGGGRG